MKKQTLIDIISDPANCYCCVLSLEPETTQDFPPGTIQLSNSTVVPSMLDASVAAFTNPTSSSLSQTPVSLTSPSSSFDSLAFTEALTVFVEDRRFNPSQKHAVSIRVQTSDRVGCGPGERRVLARNLVEQVQMSLSPIKGPSAVMLSCRHHLDPDFPLCFSGPLIPDLNDLEGVKFEPEFLIVSAANGFHLLVNSPLIPPSLSLPRETSVSSRGSTSNLSSAQPENASLEGVTVPASVTSRASNVNQNPSENSVPAGIRVRGDLRGIILEMHESTVDYLQSAAKNGNITEYERFCSNRAHHILQNEEVVFQWRYSTAFYRKWNNQTLKVSTKKVNTRAIAEALGYSSETWLRSAIKGHRLIELYGDNSEVEEEVQRQQDPPHGTAALLDFLQCFAEAHPVQEV